MKTNRYIKILILLIGISIIAVSYGRIAGYSLERKDENKIYKDSIPESLKFIEQILPDFNHITHDTISDKYMIYNEQGVAEFSVLLTSPYCDDIRGWGGVVPFAILINPDNTIRKLHLLPHYETPSWIIGLENINFFESWNGVDLNEAVELKVDAISGSTMTSGAVIKSVNKRLAIFLSVDQKKKENIFNDIGLIVSLFVLLLSIISFFFPKQLSKYRILLLILTAGVLGFWQADFLSMALLFNWLVNGLSIGSKIVLFLIMIFSFVLPLFTNKSFYCQYVCPYGSVQELAGKIPVKKIVIKKEIVKYLKSLRFILLFVVFLVIILEIDLSLEDFEPFSAFQFQFASLMVLTIAIVMLIISVFNNKFWCKYLCPTGALLSMLRFKKKKNKK